MMLYLVVKEARALVRDGRLLTLVAAMLALCVGVLWVAHTERERQRAEKQAIETATRAQWDEQGDKHPHRGAHFGMYVFAPESTLAAFDPGIQSQVGQALYLEPHRRNVSRFNSVIDDPFAGRLGEFTPAFVLIAILPLLIVTAAHGTIAGERDTGVLRMVRGTGVDLRRIVGSKVVALGVAIATLIALIFGVLVGLSDEPERTAALFFAYLIYASIFVCIGVAISAVTRTSREALVAAIAVWLVAVWIVPRVGAAIADASIELPTPDAFWSAIRRDYQQGLPGDGDLDARSRAFDQQLLTQHGVARLEDLPFGAYAVRRLNRDRYADRVYALHFDALWERLAQQEATLRSASVFSPAIAMRLLSMKLAGTDLSHRKAFEDAAELYRREFNAYIDDWDAKSTSGLRSFEDKYANNSLWRSTARFEHRPPSAGEALRNASTEVGMLLAWATAALVLLAWASSRVKL